MVRRRAAAGRPVEGVGLKRAFRLALLILLAGAGTLCLTRRSFRAADTATRKIDFDRDVRPVLADNCFACHGPDEKQRMANLRLDETEGLFADRGGYRIITAGDSAHSKLYLKISSTDPAFRMPPTFANRTLTAQQIETIKEWIDQGAKWERHWAWIAPQRPAVPDVQDKAWVRNPIDSFVLARLEREGLKPSPEADRATLLRRLSFDLTGLPPTPAELDSFLADKSPDAYEKRVDQLLASPHYGERMAMPWLDLARYADTHGYHIDSLREMWPWRDWVIAAFNRNEPYDQFTIDQLAGDLVPNATQAQKIASGFNRNHEIDYEGGAIPAEYHVEYVVDRVSTTGTTWLGLTIGCARCHDHKFDPIKQKDFYRFFAFFNTVPERGLDGITGNAEPVLELPSPEQQRRRAELESEIAKTLEAVPEKQMVSLENEWRQKELASATAVSSGNQPDEGLAARYIFEGNLKDVSGHGLDARAARGDVTYDDGAVGKAAGFSGETKVEFSKAGDFDGSRPFALAFWVRPDGTKGMELVQKRDASPNWGGYEISTDDVTFDGPQRPRFNLFVRLASRWPDNAIEVRTKDRIRFDRARHLALNYDGSGKAAGLSLFLDGKRVETEAVKDHLSGSLHSEAPLSVGDKALGRPFKGDLDDLRIYDRTLRPEEAEFLAVDVPERSLIAALAGKPVQEIEVLQPEKPPAEADIGMEDKAPSKEEQEASRLKSQQARLSEFYLKYEAPESDRKLYAQLQDLRDQLSKLNKSITTTMVMAEMQKPRDTFILGRGQYDNPGEKVTPGVPSFLPPLPAGAPLNRLTLARWIVDPANPLTARVAVNHFWQQNFGVGLVKTSEDFGSQGEPPSNQVLLDWLATEFVRSGWDVKAMERLIVTSATYRQSSKAAPELEDRDPENRLLARGPRFRLSAEEIRDNALSVSGLLNPQIGGPSAYPYQPKGVWEDGAFFEGFTAQTYQQGAGDDIYRRGMYTVWKRTAPPPELTTFDAPDREKCTARRLPTNTPLQALELLNDPTYVEAARVLAQRLMEHGGPSPVSRVDFAFRLATARAPSAAERRILIDTYNDQLQDFRAHRDDAARLLGVGESKCDPKLDRTQLAAWTTVASMILNLDETITNQ
jgi:Protein of unknown function (DUF1553)/Protein of unknown function (DUF1549)/Concanavalin A-like lectin/glucanases superfamily/Planctomycete cytochrome C